MGFRKYELGSYEEMCARHSGRCPSATTSRATCATSTTRDRLAMVWEDWHGQRAQGQLRRAAGALEPLRQRARGVGVERGDRVATLLPSLPETAAVFIGTYKRGAILLSLSVLYGDEGIQHRLSDSGAKAVVTDAANRHRIPEGMVEKVLVMGGGASRRRRGLRRRRWSARATATRWPTRSPTTPPSSTTRRAPREGQGHPARPPLPARARGVRVLPRRARRRALPRLGRVGLGRGDRPLLGPWRYGAVALVQARKGGYDPEEHLRVPRRSTGCRTCSPRPRRCGR